MRSSFNMCIADGFVTASPPFIRTSNPFKVRSSNLRSFE